MLDAAGDGGSGKGGKAQSKEPHEQTVTDNGEESCIRDGVRSCYFCCKVISFHHRCFLLVLFCPIPGLLPGEGDSRQPPTPNHHLSLSRSYPLQSVRN